MNRVSCIFLLLILLLQSGGLTLLYKIQQYMIQYKMYQKLHQNPAKLQKLTLSRLDFRKRKINSHEIFYHGEMYDFKISHTSADSVELLAIHDAHEERVLKKVGDLARHTSRQRSRSLPSCINQVLTTTYIYTHFELTFPLQLPSKNNYLLLDTLNIPTATTDVPSPPPKLA